MSPLSHLSLSSDMELSSTIKLNSGYLMPRLGLGTWLSQPGEVSTAVEYALRQGYRHVDCAAIYFNEKVGDSRKSGDWTD